MGDMPCSAFFLFMSFRGAYVHVIGMVHARTTIRFEDTMQQLSSYTRVCLLHYHEIGLKGKNRKKFEAQLSDNLHHALKPFHIEQPKRISGHILVRVHEGSASLELARKAACVPGVARVSLAYECAPNLDDMRFLAVSVLSRVGEFSSFKVHAHKSSSTIAYHTLELNTLIGDALCEAFPQKRVQMKAPDVTVHVTVVNNVVYVYASLERGYHVAGFGAHDSFDVDDDAAITQVGIGGLPVGTAGKVMVMLSSGFDSPVACWQVGRRGAICVPIHFSGRPMVADTSEYLTQDIIRALEPYGCVGRLYVCPMGEVQREISIVVPQSLRIICYRRIMFAVAERIAHIEGAKALVTGESLGQVASQTLDNIAVVNEMVTLPVFRPLIGSDKQEIIAQAQRIGTFDVSCQPTPDCCTLFMPKNPETHAKPSMVHAAWDSFDHNAMIDSLVDAIEYVDFSQCVSYRAPKEKKEFHATLMA